MALPHALPAAVVSTLVLGLTSASGAGTSGTPMLVELSPSARRTETAALVRAGATPVAVAFGLYRLSPAAAARALPGLRARGAIRYAQPDRPAGTLATLDASDPLLPQEWWRAAVGIDGLTPPGAGKAVTIVDSGLDVSHPEFLGRANTETLNAQEPAPLGGRHGTEVASLIGAPANGVGLVGIYPEALLRSWDTAKGDGTQLSTSEIVQGILTAANAGPGVINLSLGGSEKELPIEQAVYEAVRKGSLLVAASGNDGDNGNPLGYPASIPHVLTVGATGKDDQVAAFSSRSRFVDLAAPGVEIPVAIPPEDYAAGDGTSFAAPLVSGAAAWVWTVRPELSASQLYEVMRRSARDVGPPGRDDGSGFGILDVPAALAYPAPVPDSAEPNDDIEFVRPGGLYDNSIPPLTTTTRRKASAQGRLTTADDPRDVYRVWLPRNAALTATLTADVPLDLGLWQQGTVSVLERIVGKDRLARTTTGALTFRNAGAGRFAYLAVTFPKGVRDAAYTLRVSS